jgi:hypothetical protein
MIIGKPAPFVRTFIDAVDQAIRQDHPDSGLSAMQRSWLAFCVTATLVTHSICWARFERASSVCSPRTVRCKFWNTRQLGSLCSGNMHIPLD